MVALAPRGPYGRSTIVLLHPSCIADARSTKSRPPQAPGLRSLPLTVTATAVRDQCHDDRGITGRAAISLTRRERCAGRHRTAYDRAPAMQAASRSARARSPRADAAARAT